MKLAAGLLFLALLGSASAQSPVFGPPLSGAQSFNGSITAPDAVLNGPRIDVRFYGAKGDGVTDNCTALTNASNYALSVGGVLYFPRGVSAFATSCTVLFQTNWLVDGELLAIAGGTAASTALVSTGTSTTPQHVGIYGSGHINGNALSPTIIWVMQGKHINISVDIIGQGVNSKGIYFGDDAGVGNGGVEGNVYHVSFGVYSPATNPTHTNSTCVYLSTGNGTKGQFTDDDLSHNLYHGCTIGVQDHVGGNNNFTDDHAWDETMTTCFDEFAQGGTFLNEYCDSPSTSGFHVRNLQTRIIGGIAYNGTFTGGSGTATAILFDIPAEPFAWVTGIRIYGADASHKWAADSNLGFNATNSTWCDVRDGANIVTAQNGTGTCVRNGNQKYFGNIWLNTNDMYTGNVNSFTCSAVCAFGAGSNWQKATLSQNATSTWTITTPGGGVPYANFTVLICQPATGGPFTFTPPANSAGFGTIGTTAGKCNLQNFAWDGTTLRASSAMQLNE